MGLRTSVLGGTLGVLCAIIALAACSKERPPNHPLMGIHDRNASRIELVELIIQDQVRAQKVKAKYIEIEDLVKARSQERQESSVRMQALSSSHEFPEEKIRAEIESSRKVGADAYLNYVSLQLSIRKLVTADEFAKLDKVR